MNRIQSEQAAFLASLQNFNPGDRVEVVSVPAHGAEGVKVGDKGTFKSLTSSTHCNANLVAMDSGHVAAFHYHNLKK